MDLLRCEMCNCTITNFNNHKCYYDEHPFDRLVSEMLDYNFGNIHQETPATIPHSAEGDDFNSSAFTNRTSTHQSSTFPQSINQESHWDVNSTAGTNVRYTSSNTAQNENFDYFDLSQGLLNPVTQYFENSGCTSGVENPTMAFSTTASTTTLTPFEQTCPNNSAWMQHDPNWSFYNQLPPNSQGLEDPSNYLSICDPTNEYYNVLMNMQSGQSTMQDFEISRFQEKEYDPVAIAIKSDRTEFNTSCASDLNFTSINAKYQRNPLAGKEYNHMAVSQPVSSRSNTVKREKFYDEFLNIQNSAYPNFENSDSYPIPDFRQVLLDSQQGTSEIHHQSKKSQSQFEDKIKLQNVFHSTCHFCGKLSSYQRNLNDPEFPPKLCKVPFKCNECIEKLKLKTETQPRAKISEVGHKISAIKLQKIIKPREKLFSCNVCSKKFRTPSSLKTHIFTHTKEKPFSCDICSKRFSQKSNKNVHTLTHSGIRRFQCNMCGKSYTTNQCLLLHKLIHQSNN